MIQSLGKRAPVFVLLGVLVAAVGGSGLANAAGSSSQTFRVRETVTSLAQVDVGAPGLSPGDEAIYHLRIDTPAGKQIGANNVVCTILTPLSNALAHCVGTARFPAGTLEFGGIFRLQSANSTFAVTGGTGAYSSASGQGFVRWLDFPTDTKAVVTVQLTS